VIARAALLVQIAPDRAHIAFADSGIELRRIGSIERRALHGLAGEHGCQRVQAAGIGRRDRTLVQHRVLHAIHHRSPGENDIGAGSAAHAGDELA
jgi:hypothetical protein